jgi:hypothetical protein
MKVNKAKKSKFKKSLNVFVVIFLYNQVEILNIFLFASVFVTCG